MLDPRSARLKEFLLNMNTVWPRDLSLSMVLNGDPNLLVHDSEEIKTVGFVVTQKTANNDGDPEWKEIDLGLGEFTVGHA